MSFNVYPMKQTFILFLIAMSSGFTVLAQKAPGAIASSTASKVANDILDLKEPGFDFGKIPQGRPVTHNFEAINKGKTALSLDNVQASCGCTTPEWSEAPIAPGGSSIIKVGFNAASEGHFTKTITVTYNGGQVKTFTISGEVYASPTTSAPLNTSLSLIK